MTAHGRIHALLTLPLRRPPYTRSETYKRPPPFPPLPPALPLSFAQRTPCSSTASRACTAWRRTPTLSRPPPRRSTTLRSASGRRARVRNPPPPPARPAPPPAPPPPTSVLHSVTAQGDAAGELSRAARLAARSARLRSNLQKTPPTPPPPTAPSRASCAPLTQARCAATTARSAPRAAWTPSAAPARATATSWQPPSAGTAAVRCVGGWRGTARSIFAQSPLPLSSFSRAPNAVSPAPSPARPSPESNTQTLFDASPRPPFYAGLAANTAAALEAKREAQALAPPRPHTAQEREELSFAERALAEMAAGRARGR